jgi:hypothetical protein
MVATLVVSGTISMLTRFGGSSLLFVPASTKINFSDVPWMLRLTDEKKNLSWENCLAGKVDRGSVRDMSCFCLLLVLVNHDSLDDAANWPKMRCAQDLKEILALTAS